VNDRPAACTVGCTIRGQHRADCADRDKCRGCIPRPAEYGTLCAWCWQRLQSDVATAPAVVAHLREVGEPAAQAAPPSDTQAHGDPSEGAILPAAWGAADELHADLASWALLILEQHPAAATFAGPNEVGAWHTRYGTVVGVLHEEATTNLARWLIPLLPWCSEQEWAAEMRRELGSLTATTLARWPMQDTRTREVPGIRCVRCGEASLVYTPTAGYKLPFHVACTSPDCGRIYTEAEYDAALAKMTIERGYVA
jgi:hypothetical protein